MLTRKSLDLYLVIIFTILAIGLTALDTTPKPIKTLFALPMVILLPGYALTTALFTHAEFDRAKTLLFSLALSIVLTIWCGFALNLTLWGIQAGSWATVLGDLTLVAAVVGLVRRGRAQPAQEGNKPGLRIRLVDSLFLALAVLITVLSVGAARTGSTQTGAVFTQFWMLPKDSQSIQIGIQNMERQAEQYRVELMIGSMVVYESAEVDLNAGDQWQITLPVSKEWAANGTVDALLYRLDEPATVYRHTSIVLSGSGVSP